VTQTQNQIYETQVLVDVSVSALPIRLPSGARRGVEGDFSPSMQTLSHTKRPDAGTRASQRGPSGWGHRQADLGAQPRAHLSDCGVDLGNPAGPQEEVVLPLGQRAKL